MSAAPYTLNCPLCRRKMQKTSPATWWCQHDRTVLTCRRSTGAERRYALQLPGESSADEPAPSAPEVKAPSAAAPCPRRLVRISAVLVEPTGVRIGDVLAAHGRLRMVTGLQRAGSSGTARVLMLRGGRELREKRFVLRGPCLVYRDPDGAPVPAGSPRAVARTQ